MTFLTKFLRNVNDSNLKYHCKFQVDIPVNKLQLLAIS